MGYRKLLILLAAAVAGLTGMPDSSTAETIAVDNGIAIKQSDIATPSRGMTMDQVAAKFGSPATKVPAVGQPPITRWDYPGFVVYFEHSYVIHSVVVDT